MKAFRVAFSTRFKDDYTYWQRHDRQKCLKIDDLIKNTIADPFKGCSVETCSAGRSGAHPYRCRRSGSVL